MNGKDLISLSAGLVALAISLALLMPSKPKRLNPDFTDNLIEAQFEVERTQALKAQEERKLKTTEAQRQLVAQVKKALQELGQLELKPALPVPSIQPLPPVAAVPVADPVPRHRGLFFRSLHLRHDENCVLP
jgi:hypothetical protein